MNTVKKSHIPMQAADEKKILLSGGMFKHTAKKSAAGIEEAAWYR